MHMHGQVVENSATFLDQFATQPRWIVELSYRVRFRFISEMGDHRGSYDTRAEVTTAVGPDGLVLETEQVERGRTEIDGHMSTIGWA